MVKINVIFLTKTIIPKMFSVTKAFDSIVYFIVLIARYTKVYLLKSKYDNSIALNFVSRLYAVPL